MVELAVKSGSPRIDYYTHGRLPTLDSPLEIPHKPSSRWSGHDKVVISRMRDKTISDELFTRLRLRERSRCIKFFATRIISTSGSISSILDKIKGVKIFLTKTKSSIFTTEGPITKLKCWPRRHLLPVGGIMTDTYSNLRLHTWNLLFQLYIMAVSLARWLFLKACQGLPPKIHPSSTS